MELFHSWFTDTFKVHLLFQVSGQGGFGHASSSWKYQTKLYMQVPERGKEGNYDERDGGKCNVKRNRKNVHKGT